MKTTSDPLSLSKRMHERTRRKILFQKFGLPAIPRLTRARELSSRELPSIVVYSHVARTSMPSLLLPDAQPILTALAILALTAACRFGFAVVTRLLGTSKRLLWPAAGAMASLPFVLREPLLAWWGGTYADAQLGSFLAATAFAWCFFRAIERSVGTTPVGAAASLAEWIFYMSADVDPRYGDGRPLRPPPGKLQSQLAKLCATYAATAAFVSAIEPFGFRPTAAVCEACGVSGPLAAALVRVGDNLSGAAFRSSAASAPLLLASQLGALAEPSRNLLSAGTVLIYLFLSLLLTLGSILVLAQGHDPIDGGVTPSPTPTVPNPYLTPTVPKPTCLQASTTLSSNPAVRASSGAAAGTCRQISSYLPISWAFAGISQPSGFG